MTGGLIDEPGTPAESIVPPGSTGETATEATEADVEEDIEVIRVDDDADAATDPTSSPHGEAAASTPTKKDGVDVDDAFDRLLADAEKAAEEEERKKLEGQLSGAVPLSRPGDGAMVSAVNKEVAKDWKTGSGRNDASGSGSGSRSSSSLDRVTPKPK